MTAFGENFINAGTACTLDGFSIVGGHEYAEAVTDPVPPTGRIDLADGVSGGEIADKCAWAGAIWGTPDPAGNLTLLTGTFAMQSLWSNATGGCVMSGTLPFSVTPLGSRTSLLRQAVSLQVHGATTPATPLTAGSQYVNKASGRCLTDPGLSKVNGTQLTPAACKNTAGQRWSLP